MIIEKISVRGFRTLDEELIVPGENETFSSDVNIIAGENETGKSSLMLALVRALFDDHDTGGKQMERIRPWGTSLSPEVTVEFAVDGTDYRIEKRFLDDTSSRLFKKENGSFSPFADGSDADEKVRALFEGSSSRGPSGPGDWGIARALYLRQETSLFEDDEDLTELTGQLGDDETSMALSPLEQYVTSQIEDRYDRGYFTPSGSYTTKNGTPGEKLQKMQEKLNHLREKLEELEDKKGEAEKKQQQIEKIRDKIETSNKRLADHRETIADLEKRLDDLQVLQEKHQDLKNREEEIEEELSGLREDLEEFESLNDTITDTKKVHLELEDEIEALETQQENLETQRSELQEDINETKIQQEKLRERLKIARKRKKAIELDREIAVLKNREKRVIDLDDQLEEIEDELSGRPVPGDEDVEELQEINNTLRDKQTELDSVGLSISLSAEAEWTLSCGRSPEDAEEKTLNAGEKTTEHLDDRVYIEIPGKGKIEVSSQAGEIEDIAEEIDEKQKKKNEILDRFSVEDLDELRTWKHSAEKKTEKQERLEKKRMELLGESHNDIAELKQDRNQKENELHRKLQELEEERGDLPEEVTELEELREQKQELEHTLDELRDKRDEKQEKLEDIREELSEKKEEEADQEARLDEKQDQRDDLIDEYESIENLEQSIEKQEGNLEEIRAKLAEIQEKIPGEDEDPETQIEELHEKIEQLEEEKKSDQAKITKLETQLEGIQDEGLSGSINETEEKIEHLEQQVQSEREKARGIKLLKKILDARQEQRVQNFVRPLQTRVNRYFRMITGENERKVMLDENLSPSALNPDHAGGDLEFSELDHERALSGGAREQLLLSLRMAAARQISEAGEPHFLVLDDILGNTDPDRYENVLELLDDESEYLQIFVLTSTPDRYRDLNNRKEINLDRLKLGLE